MNTNLYKQGWGKMEQILDQEMPVQKKSKKYPFILLFFIGMILSFVAGYLFNQQKSDTIRTTSLNQPKEVVQQTRDISSTIQSITNSTPVDHVKQSAIGEITNEQKKVKKLKNNSTSNALIFHPSPSSIVPQSQNIEVSNNTNDKTIDINSTVADQESFLSVLPLYLSHINRTEPSIMAPKVLLNSPTKKPFLQHQMGLSTGYGVFPGGNSSVGLRYSMSTNIGKFRPNISLGYLYHRANLKVTIDTVNKASQPSFQDADQVTIDIKQFHQLHFSLGFDYRIGSHLFFTTGLNIPYRFHSFGFTKNEFDQFSAEENSPVNSQSGILYHAAFPKNIYHSWDIQPYLGIGVDIKRNIQYLLTYQAGLKPINKVVLATGNNVYFSQIIGRFNYTF
ncbi:MAG: hypothetical protein WAT79_15540 [Saprospiraceae bacterium]